MSPQAEIFRYFLFLGLTGFGGPLALVAMMQKDLVEKRKWQSLEDFQRAFTLIKAMPGAVAFNTAVFLGRGRGGFWGGTLAGLGLLLPSFVLVTLFAIFHGELTSVPSVGPLLLGTQAAALALIALALKPLMGRAAGQPSFWVIVLLGALFFGFSSVPEPVLIVGAGVIWVLWKSRPQAFTSAAFAMPLVENSERLPDLMAVCLKAGAFVFGTGLAIAPLLEKDFVQGRAWLTSSEFMDALAIGQITPGPVLLTVTFLGYKASGLAGAALATVAIFLPGYLHMMTWFPGAVRWLSKQKWIENFLFGALGIVVGTILATLLRLSLAWTDQPHLYLIVVVAFVAALRWKIPSWALVLGGGGLGWLMGFVFS